MNIRITAVVLVSEPLQPFMAHTTINDHLWVIRWIILDDPVHLWDIQAPCSNICTEQDARVSIAELEEGGSALRLLLLALFNTKMRAHVMNIQNKTTLQ